MLTKEVYSQWIRDGAPQQETSYYNLQRKRRWRGWNILRSSWCIFQGQRTMTYRSHPKNSKNQILLYSLLIVCPKSRIEDFSNGEKTVAYADSDCGGNYYFNAPPHFQTTPNRQILSRGQAIFTTEKSSSPPGQQQKNWLPAIAHSKKRFAEVSVKSGNVILWGIWFLLIKSQYRKKHTKDYFFQIFL